VTTTGQITCDIMTAAPRHGPRTLERLCSVPGIGPVLSRVWLGAIHDIHRVIVPDHPARDYRDGHGRIRGK
jgi:hypothetical protein